MSTNARGVLRREGPLVPLLTSTLNIETVKHIIMTKQAIPLTKDMSDVLDCIAASILQAPGSQLDVCSGPSLLR